MHVSVAGDRRSLADSEPYCQYPAELEDVLAQPASVAAAAIKIAICFIIFVQTCDLFWLGALFGRSALREYLWSVTKGFRGGICGQSSRSIATSRSFPALHAALFSALAPARRS